MKELLRVQPNELSPGCRDEDLDLAVELQKIYDSEINVSIGWMWDGGVTLRLGDDIG